jgi:hypothetical protein
MERKNQEFVELEQKVTWIIKDLDQVAKKSSIQSESDFILLDSMKMFVQKWKKVCEGAQESMDITFSGGNLPKAMFFIREKWKKALERGIKVRLITEKRKDQQVIPQIEEFLKTPNFQIGFILQRIPAMISIFDNKEIFISTRAPEGIKNVRVLWSNHAGLTALLKAYFDLEWKKAQN